MRRPLTILVLVSLVTGLLTSAATALVDPPVKLNQTLVTEGQVEGFTITPNDQTVVYFADAVTDGDFDVYSIPISGGSPVNLTTSLPGGYVGLYLQTTSDGAHVVFAADHDDDTNFEALYSAQVGVADSAVQISSSLQAAGDITHVEIADDDATVVYRADADFDERFELFAATIGDDDSTVKLATMGHVDGDVVATLGWVQAGDRVVYQADEDTDEQFEAYSVKLDGTDPQNLSPTLIGAGDVGSADGSVGTFGIAGSRVLFLADANIDTVDELFSAPIDGSGPAVALNPSYTTEDGVAHYVIFNGGSEVLYVADDVTDTVQDIFRAPSDGSSASTRLNDPHGTGDEVVRLSVFDDAVAVFTADWNTANQLDLYSIDLSGSGAFTKLNGSIVDPAGDVDNFFGSVPLRRVIYEVDGDVDAVFEIFSTRWDGSGSPTQIGPDGVNAEFAANPWALSPDGRRLNFRGDLGSGQDGLYVADARGGPLTEIYQPTNGFTDVYLSPLEWTASWIPFLADLGTDANSELYVVRADHLVVDRYAGANRFGTAADISANDYPSPDGADTVFVAVGTNFPDAVSGAAVAGKLGAPLLLVNTASIPGETLAELTRLAPSQIVILGGTVAVSDAVETALESLGWGPTVTRLAGANRYVTSVEISKHGFPDGADTVVIATGTVFADALAGAPAAVEWDAPVLLTDPNALPAVIAAEITRLDPNRIVVLGGTAAVTSTVFDALAAIAPTERISGPDRYATAIAISAAAFGSARRAYVATGLNFPDALAGAAAAAAYMAPILLVPGTTLPGTVQSELERLGSPDIVVLGGTVAVATAVQDALEAMLGI